MTIVRHAPAPAGCGRRGIPRTANLWFDFAGLVHADHSTDPAELMATRMRQIGLDRILYASDSARGTPANPSTHQHRTATRRSLPLTDEELRIVASDIAPYQRGSLQLLE
jgi:uncharacterized protein